MAAWLPNHNYVVVLQLQPGKAHSILLRVLNHAQTHC